MNHFLLDMACGGMIFTKKSQIKEKNSHFFFFCIHFFHVITVP